MLVIMLEELPVGKRGHVFSFTNPYFHNSYLVFGSEQVLICDTSCGPEPMKHVKRFIETHTSKDQQVIIFNSHHHYDHVWGNSVFAKESIYAHKSCYEALEKTGERDLIEFAAHKRGEVRLVLPNMTFDDIVLLDDGNIELFHSPGHTFDSSSCIDHVDRVLFVGDNVESPIPYVFDADLDQYIATLVEYQSIDWDYLVTGHDPVQTDRTLLENNIEYLSRLRSWSIRLEDLPPEARFRHIENLVNLAKLVNPSEFDAKAKLCMTDARDALRSQYQEHSQAKDMIGVLDKVITGQWESEELGG